MLGDRFSRFFGGRRGAAASTPSALSEGRSRPLLPPSQAGAFAQAMAQPPPIHTMLNQLLDRLRVYIPGSVPPNNISVVSHMPRSVGIGNLRGTASRGIFGIVELKGGRLEAVVRFELWGASTGAVEGDALTLVSTLAEQADALRVLGFLKLSQEDARPSEFISGPNNWRKIIDFSTLYEYVYDDTDGADSLITRIPVDIGLDQSGVLPEEQMELTDKMIRWDNEQAPVLQFTGPVAIQVISALSFIAGVAPSGRVFITRTFDGAGPPVLHPLFADFLAAVTDPVSPERNAQCTFASVSDWLAEFSTAGDDVALGDWNIDTVADAYEALMIAFGAPVLLDGPADRLEIAFEHPAFDTVAVLYMQAL